MACRAEFMIEPFTEGAPGPHVLAGIDAARGLGFDPEIGPFGNAITGERAQVLAAVAAVLEAAAGAGASRVSLQIDYGI